MSDITTTQPGGKLLTGRVVTIVTLVLGAAGAAVPALANMDVSSSAGIIAGLVAMAGVVVKYLDGWQKHEARVAAQPPAATGAPVAIGDPTVAVAPVPEPTVSGPNGSPPGAAALSDPDEPEPGAVDKPLELVTDEDVADVPGPPTDEEIAAVSDELKQGSPPARRAA